MKELNTSFVDTFKTTWKSTTYSVIETMASDQDTPVRPSCSPPCMTSSDPVMPDDVVISDFSKAFDTVPYNKLRYKLDHYSVQGPVHTWITNFLTSRKMRVVLEGETSEEAAQRKVPYSSCAAATTCQRP